MKSHKNLLTTTSLSEKKNAVYMLSQTKTDEMKEDEEEETMTKKQKQE